MAEGVSSLFARETEVATIDEQLRNGRRRTRGRRKLPKEFVAPRTYLGGEAKQGRWASKESLAENQDCSPGTSHRQDSPSRGS